MDELRSQVDPDRLPRHIAVIMDGNGRWARQNGRKRVFGHRHGVKSVRDITEGCAELGVKFLTLYAFSTENWQRPKAEVNALMGLLVNTIRNEMSTLKKNDIKLNAIGQLDTLPERTSRELRSAIEATQHHSRMTLTLALSYSSRSEILAAVRSLAGEVAEGKLDPAEIDDSKMSDALWTKGIPDPELLIRTSGEQRISNYLLWQMAYTEFHFCPTLWPDFRKADLYNALIDYQSRERRFGLTTEQLKS